MTRLNYSETEKISKENTQQIQSTRQPANKTKNAQLNSTKIPENAAVNRKELRQIQTKETSSSQRKKLDWKKTQQENNTQLNSDSLHDWLN